MPTMCCGDEASSALRFNAAEKIVLQRFMVPGPMMKAAE